MLTSDTQRDFLSHYQPLTGVATGNAAHERYPGQNKSKLCMHIAIWIIKELAIAAISSNMHFCL